MVCQRLPLADTGDRGQVLGLCVANSNAHTKFPVAGCTVLRSLRPHPLQVTENLLSGPLFEASESGALGPATCCCRSCASQASGQWPW